MKNSLSDISQGCSRGRDLRDQDWDWDMGGRDQDRGHLKLGLEAGLETKAGSRDPVDKAGTSETKTETETWATETKTETEAINIRSRGRPRDRGRSSRPPSLLLI